MVSRIESGLVASIALLAWVAAAVRVDAPTLGLALAVTALAGLWWRARRSEAAIRAEAERAEQEHRLLAESIDTNPMPFAVYDQSDRLRAWNRAYARTHEGVFAQLSRREEAYGLKYADLVRMEAQATLPPQEVEAHVAQRLERQHQAEGLGVDRIYPGLGWLRVSKFVTPSGAVAGFAMDINELKQREAELERQIAVSKSLESRLRLLADTDPMTELANRRAFMDRAESEFRRAQRRGQPLSVLMMDIDHFKTVNDNHGHQVGDEVITSVAQLAASQLRADVDLIGRLGGEEFAVVMPYMTGDQAAIRAEHIRRLIEAFDFGSGVGAGMLMTVSLGVSQLGESDREFASVLARADRALYRAKEAGRNRVAMVGEVDTAL